VLAAYCSVPRLVLGKVIVVRMVSTSVSRSNDVKHILIGFQQALSPQDVCILVAALNKHLQSALHNKEKRKENEKTTPFGVNSMRSQVLYQAAQVHDKDVLFLKSVMQSGSAYHLLASLLQLPLLNHSLLMSYLLPLCDVLF